MNSSKRQVPKKITRRKFLYTSALAAGSIAASPLINSALVTEFPNSERLGRVTEKVDIKLNPNYDSATIGYLYDDAVIPCLQEVVGKNIYRNSQRWIETPEGYVWSPKIQPVKNVTNSPIESIPEGMNGIWVEVTVPWVNIILDNPSANSTFWDLQAHKNLPYRFYYSQVLWVDQIKVGSDGNIWYRINERFGPGDLFWAPAEAFRPISSAELAPINPEVENKQIVVDVTDSHQYLSCFEGNNEVYFCRISSGTIPFTTPLSGYGSPGFYIWRKLHSIHMAGGSNEGGWMIPGIGWTTFFRGDGIAIHSTFWHNNFGEMASHGCVNVSPDDAKWIYRWTNPIVPYQEGDIKVSGTIGTPIKVIEY